MRSPELTGADRAQLARAGISEGEALRQLALLREPPRPIRLARPCTPGDGIATLDPSAHAGLLARHDAAARAGRLLRMVPASGAASRMFQGLQGIVQEAPGIDAASARRRAAGGDRAAADLVAFAEGLDRFAFREALDQALGGALERLRQQGAWGEIARALLAEPGLDYAAMPKGLLLFHRYPGGGRAPFEEHLVEAAQTVRAGDGATRVHYTVAGEHQQRFEARLEGVRRWVEAAHQTRLEVGFSTQSPATDTLAIDAQGQPFRLDDGTLLLRPGGHGALLANLEALHGDLVVIKNIDNVLHASRSGDTLLWKRLLAGYLVLLEERLRAAGAPDRAAEELDADLEFVRSRLSVSLPGDLSAAPPDRKRAFLADLAARPLRVCGVVRNQGEPGGGPFWVSGEAGASAQIVESSQADLADPGQKAIWASSTHFNPVDLVCSVRDAGGRQRRLADFVDESTVFLAKKSREGRALTALERPGLWNGAMARWTTAFVEVPVSTFAPVKTVLDLLRPDHQPLES